ncbi:helix-turn-helix transcriptional regulator [Pseudoalteromonas denitrificans]|uniref:Putative transcriptional regulator n=1 Tax=Pseudoalteromonas denitrificans DSM 6059 TaxID=1123010 RepID=A0A1I1RHV0_9GAMM|nr:helix-turn-helix transcriptional regulator [Pseudoalteromonas denitrificans]SFD33905.1 putative transcriptional regulator [Pseudoalteromonas denitrificans DSM 6059]
MELSNTLKIHRATHNLTQADLAMEVGVSRKTINTVENGKFIPSTVLALKIASVLNVTVEEIFYLK